MRKVIITYTDEQAAAEESLLAITREDRAKMIRRLVAAECLKHGVAWIDNMPKPSRKRKVL